jgi:hypothetical protein
LNPNPATKEAKMDFITYVEQNLKEALSGIMAGYEGEIEARSAPAPWKVVVSSPALSALLSLALVGLLMALACSLKRVLLT